MGSPFGNSNNQNKLFGERKKSVYLPGILSHRWIPPYSFQAI